MTDAFVKETDSQKMTREQKIRRFSHDYESRIHAFKDRGIKFVVITQQSLLSRSSSRKRAMQETSTQRTMSLHITTFVCGMQIVPDKKNDEEEDELLPEEEERG